MASNSDHRDGGWEGCVRVEENKRDGKQPQTTSSYQTADIRSQTHNANLEYKAET